MHAKAINRIGAIIVLALILAGINGYVSGNWDVALAPIGSDTSGFGKTGFGVGRAISILETGTLNYGGEGFLGLQGLRGPFYPILMALVFCIFGQKMWAIFLLNAFLFAGAIFLLWRISSRLFSGGWRFLSPLFLACFWLASSLVMQPSYEIFSLFLATGSFSSLFVYGETLKKRWLVISAICFAIWILERPAMLYFLPFVLVILFVFLRRSRSLKNVAMHSGIFLLVAGVFIGGWSYHNHLEYGTWQIGAGGPVLLRRASQVDFSYQQIASMAISFTLGDFIGLRVDPNYPADGKPPTWDPAVDDRWYQKGWLITEPSGEVISRIELDRRTYREAIAKAKAQPVKFILSGVPNLFRLNGPTNYGGQEFMHFFVGSYEQIPASVKMAIVVMIRAAWYMFLALVVFAVVKLWRSRYEWGALAVFIIYHNILHIFLTHAEARYLLMAIPFYFLFFAEGLRLLNGHFLQR